ncbi:MAG: hypothetical protein WBP43_05545 [Chitinophagales bacterium]|nr:hypothetical protein [Bacteroidota bacterium]
MKRVLTAYFTAVIVLLIFSYAALYFSIFFFPKIAEQYFDPIFSSSEKRTWMYFAHPFIVALALKYFWQRFRHMFKGGPGRRGAEVGLIYGLIAVLPAMWITFSGISISISVVATWILYGTLQGIIAGVIYAKMNP